MEEEGRDRGPLFGDVVFTIVPSDDIPHSAAVSVSYNWACLALADRANS